MLREVELLETPSMESRENLLSLQLIISDSPLLRLLPSLLQRRKLSHRRNAMAPPLELILRVALALQKRRVNRVKHKVILCA